jgi:hypothetical protein
LVDGSVRTFLTLRINITLKKTWRKPEKRS